jgi:hypothetical protein
MKIIDIVAQLLPLGTDAASFNTAPTAVFLNSHVGLRSSNIHFGLCPIWPPDLFAVVGTIIDRSGCYTSASPDRSNLPGHVLYLDEIRTIARQWTDVFRPPQEVTELWTTLVTSFGATPMSQVCSSPALVKTLLMLFAIADEVSVGMGWDVEWKGENDTNIFASIVLLNLAGKTPLALPYLPYSLCGMVSPEAAIVLPKSITSSVGCTIRSLSHYLALLPPKTVIAPSWILTSTPRSNARDDPSLPYDIRLLLVPFPFTIHAESFQRSTARTAFGSANHIPAYFKLVQRWLESASGPLSGNELAAKLFIPLIQQAEKESGWIPNGIILPECALSAELAEDLVKELKNSGIEFVITGVLERNRVTGRMHNSAKTFVIRSDAGAVAEAQNKHHRWRLDRQQTNRYALDFDPDHTNDKWWEDIDVGDRRLPFFGLRKDMSITTLICEDLARTDPAMTAIRAVGPNLVVALLMDGPQLAVRWPGRYATVLAEDPGSAVLTLTCAAMVDRSNWLEAKPARSIGLWRDAGGTMQELGLPGGSLGMLLTLQSARKHQNTLDNRSDGSLSRQLTLSTVVPLFLANRPAWI